MGTICITIKRGDIMKYKLLCILLFSTFTIGCSNEIDMASTTDKPATIQTQARVDQNKLRVINSQTALNRGGIGYVTIQGMPRTKYTLKSSYRVGNRLVDIIQWRITGDSGQATFNWTVSPETTPETHDIFIFGGGENLRLAHTVLP